MALNFFGSGLVLLANKVIVSRLFLMV